MAALVVGAGSGPIARLQLLHPLQQPLPLLAERSGLLELGLQPAQLGGGLRELLLQRRPAPVELRQLGRLVLELVDPLLVVIAVGDDLLHLAVEQSETFPYSAPSGRVQVGQSPSGPAFTSRWRWSRSSW